MFDQTELLCTFLLVFIVAFLVSTVLLPGLARIARRVGLMDHPSGRKVHSRPTPLVGGLGMASAVCTGSLLFMPLTNMAGFFAGMVVLLGAGFIDDLREINHRWKLVAQVVAAILIIYYGGTFLHTLGNLLSFGPVNLNHTAIPVSIFCIVGVTNAFNMMDGVDGLAGAVSLNVFLSFAIMAMLTHHAVLLILSGAIIGALMGFLKYNWHPSKLFMGNAGSYFLGFSAAFMAIGITQRGDAVVQPAAALWILAVPIVDSVSVILKRLIRRKSPFLADRSHIHHGLLRMGFSKPQVVTIIFFFSFACSCVALAGTLFRLPDHLLFLIFMGFFLLYVFFSFYPWNPRILQFVPGCRTLTAASRLTVKEIK